MQKVYEDPEPIKMRILVIGAGPAGLTAASHFSRNEKFDVTVVEADAVPGGMTRSILLWGRRVDLGPHRFFSSNRRVNEFWLSMTRNCHHLVTRKTSIHFDGKLLPYPLTLEGVYQALNFISLARAAISYIYRCLLPLRPAVSFSDVIINRFGDYLYRLFFESYTEKVWGYPCNQLDKDFALQRINSFSLGAAFRSFFSRLQSFHKTLLSHFVYPDEGAGAVYENMASELQRHGGRILYNRSVAKLNFSGERFVSLELNDGTVLEADYCISTMPLNALLRQSGGVSEKLRYELADKLRFRHTILVYLRLADSRLFSEQWIYVNEKHLCIGRITNFNNWSAQSYDDTILCLELWCHPGDDVWYRNDHDIAARAIHDFQSLMHFKDVKILDSHVIRVPNSYPVYLRGYRDVLKDIEELFSGYKNFLCIGRAGAYRYNNQDHSILMGMLAYENIAMSAKHNIWRENLEDKYFESATLRDSGLDASVKERHG